jgi:hypothetical protein
VKEVVDLRQSGIDSHELGAALGEQVFAEAATAVELDEEPAQVAELLVADVEKRTLLPAQHSGVWPARSDSVGAGTAVTSSPPVERPHGLKSKRF